MKREEYSLEDTQKFLSPDGEPSTTIKIVDPSDPSMHKHQGPRVTFNGLSKEEILKYGRDPTWVRIRWAIFVLFWVAWVGMLAFAVLIVLVTPKCPYRPKLNWWHSELVYQLDVATFKDSNGDGLGDLRGVADSAAHFGLLGVRVVGLGESLLDKADPSQVRAELGGDEGLRALKKAFDEKDIHLMIDIPASSLESAKNDEDTLSKWLNDYVDGVRITQLDKLSLSGEDRTKKLNKWIEIGKKIFEKTFRPKTVMFYPYTPAGKDSPRPEVVVDRSLLEIRDEDLKDASKLASKFKLSDDSTGYILGDFNSKRVADRITDNQQRAVYTGLTLLLKGSPFLLFGDELEFSEKDKHMKWDDSRPSCGFSTATNTTASECTHTATHADSYGSSETTLLRIHKRLIELRAKEPSFKWGALNLAATGGGGDEDVVSYVREADRFDGFVVVGNLNSGGGKKTSSSSSSRLVDLKKRHDLPDKATVEYSFAADGSLSADFARKKTVEVHKLNVEGGLFLVLRFTREEDTSSADSGASSSAGHG